MYSENDNNYDMLNGSVDCPVSFDWNVKMICEKMANRKR